MHPDESVPTASQEAQQFRDECVKRAEVCFQRAAELRQAGELHASEATLLEVQAEAAQQAASHIDQPRDIASPASVPPSYGEPIPRPQVTGVRAY